MNNLLKNILKQEKSQDFILTPKINEWLLTHADEPLSDELAALVAKQLSLKPRERSASFSASSAGLCLRRQELAYLGKPERPNSPQLKNTFKDGHWRHLRWQTMLLSAQLLEEIEVPLEWPKYHSKGSADGRGYIWWETANPKYRNREFIWEHKGVGSRVWEKKAEQDTPTEEHLKQVHRYMLVSGIDLCVVTYEDKGNWSNLGWKEFIVEADPDLLRESKEELEKLDRARQTKKLHPLLPECKIGTGTTYAYCPFGGKNGVCKSMKNWDD